MTKKIMALFGRLHGSGENTILLVTHEDDIARHAGRTVRLRDGLVESDSANGLANSFRESAAVLGSDVLYVSQRPP